MENLRVEIDEKALQGKLKNSKVLLLYRRAEKNPMLFVDLVEYLFGEEKTDEIFEAYPDTEELGSFLAQILTSKA